MEMQTGIVNSEKFKNTKFSIFKNLFYHKPPSISEIIDTLKWGSNRTIREQGFKILPITAEVKLIKKWLLIKDPYFIFNESSYISQPKGQSIAVVHVKVYPEGIE